MTTYSTDHAVVFLDGSTAAQESCHKDEHTDDDEYNGNSVSHASCEVHILTVLSQYQCSTDNDY